MGRIERIRREIEELMERLEENLRKARGEGAEDGPPPQGAGDEGSATQGEEFVSQEAPGAGRTKPAPKEPVKKTREI